MISEQALRDVHNAAIIELEINQSGASCRPDVLAAVYSRSASSSC
jgi:hypothetical protein